MPSFTSSSEPPRGRWGLAWLLALVLAVAFGVEWEAFWRGRGFVPSVRDSKEVWAVARGRATGNAVVLVGSSRIQSAIRPETFAAQFDGRLPVHLGIPAGSPLPVLQDLAVDEDFHGLVIVDMIPRLVFNARRIGVAQTRPYVTAHETARHSPAAWLEARLRLGVSSLIAFRSPTHDERSIVDDLLAGNQPQPPIYVTRPDRFRALEFPDRREPRRALAWARTFRREFQPAATGQLEAHILFQLRRAVKRIEARGGRVVLVRLPVSGDCRAAEEELYPRADYWEKAVARSGALAIHFADHSTLAAFGCGDCSHLDHRDTPAFTAAFVEVLASRLTAAGR